MRFRVTLMAVAPMNESSFVMLSERLAQGVVPPQEALGCATALADALRRLHDQGAVAGCLDPSKIMMGPQGAEIQSGVDAGGVTPYALASADGARSSA